ncbi:MAG: methyl-accepting chemotaxis protein [Lachnospiraceae bacterium]|nr:methyl-accepting chemotaxis protein [Lachnospiraceae bacterium]
MENNFENLTPNTEDVLADAVSEEVTSSEAEEAIAMIEDYAVSSDIAENLPELQQDKKASKKAKKEKVAKEPKPKKEKAPKAPKPKKEKAPKENLSDEEMAKKVLSKRKKVHFMNFSRRLAVMCIIPLLLLCIIISIVSSNILTKNLEKEIESSLKIVATSLEETYSTLYVGEYKMGQDGRLYKGGENISGDTSLLDSLKADTGFDSSFYWGDRVIITSVLRMEDGELLGGKITGNKHITKEIVAEFSAGNEVFVTDFLLQDVEYYGYFKPLVNPDGTIVGCIFSGKPAAEVEAQISAETRKITLSTILISAACVILIVIISNNMSKNMVKTKNFLEVVSTGDLRQNAKLKYLKRDDELGDMYAISYSLQEELKGIVTNIKASADDLAVSSEDLMHLSQNTVQNVSGLYDSVEFISRGAADQADQTSVAAIQVSNIGDQIDSISEDVSSLTEAASQMAEAEKASTSIINELNVSNEEMIDSIEKIATQIEITNTSVQEIRTAIAMIQSISDETDLLSINASIEAAHAGDAGRGFAVVAEQISKLAAQSGNNATEIEKIINALLEQSNLMVNYMDDVKIKISEQREKLDMTIDKFSAVANGVDNSLVNIGNITNGMNELRKSRDVILDVISDLSAVSQQYAASTSGTIEAAQTMNEAMTAVENASQKLKNMSDDLTKELEIFKLS